MAPCRSNSRRMNEKSLKPARHLNDVKCPICFGILIEPVTTPCNHELCLDCFNSNIEYVQIACPVCRRRISVWVRQAERSNKLVDTERWEQIKKSFPDQVRRRMDGDQDDINEDDDAPAIHNFCKPGEIRQEYEELLKKFQEDLEREREQEALASEQLIRELQRQERQQMVEERLIRQHVTTQDQVLAKDICRHYIKSVRTRSRTSCNQKLPVDTVKHSQIVFTPAVTMKGTLTSELLASLDKENTQFRSTSAESHDSISSEMCHFKPISAAPRTPPKRLPDGRFEEPEVVYTKPRRLDYSEFQSSKVLSVKIQAIMVDSRNKSECCSVPIHSTGTPFINKKFSGARKPNIDLSFKENYPYYSGSGSQSLSPTKSVLTGANQNGSTSTRIIKNTRSSKAIHKSEVNSDESNTLRKRKADDKTGQCKMTRVESCEETDASTSDSQPPSTNRDDCDDWAELQRQALDKIKQEEKDLQLAIQLQDEFNRSLQRGQQGTGNQYFLRSQKKK